MPQSHYYASPQNPQDSLIILHNHVFVELTTGSILCCKQRREKERERERERENQVAKKYENKMQQIRDSVYSITDTYI